MVSSDVVIDASQCPSADGRPGGAGVADRARSRLSARERVPGDWWHGGDACDPGGRVFAGAARALLELALAGRVVRRAMHPCRPVRSVTTGADAVVGDRRHVDRVAPVAGSDRLGDPRRVDPHIERHDASVLGVGVGSLARFSAESAKDTVACALGRLRRAGRVTACQTRTTAGIFTTGSYLLTIPDSVTITSADEPLELGVRARRSADGQLACDRFLIGTTQMTSRPDESSIDRQVPAGRGASRVAGDDAVRGESAAATAKYYGRYLAWTR